MLRDRIQKQVYPKRKNTATILNYLEELVLISAKEVGLVPIDKDGNGYQDISLPFGELIVLKVPEEAVSATIMVEQGVQTVIDDPDDDPIESIAAIPTRKQIVSVVKDGNTMLTNNTVIMRFKENGALPTMNSGFGLGNQDIFELVGAENLRQFKAMGVQQNGTPVLRIQFYKTGQFK